MSYEPVQSRVLKVQNETPEIKRLKIHYSVQHEPGQFVMLSVFGVGEAALSLCSYASDYIEVCVRKVGNVTGALFELKEGMRVGVRGPFGHGYPMHEFVGKDIILIGGGTGAASLRGVLAYLETRPKSTGSVDLFLGYRSPSDVLFNREMARWKGIFNLQVTVDKAAPGWHGKIGVVTSLLKNAKLPRQNSVVLTCGPPIMIRFVIKELLEMGFEERQLWVSLERKMKCGMGKCGHCMVQSVYVCRDGPVFNYPDIKGVED